MNKLLAVGILGLALGLAGNQAKAHDEAAYFVLGTIVGNALNGHHVRHAPVVHYVPSRHYPVHYRSYYPPPRKVVVYRDDYRGHDYRRHGYRAGKAEHRWKGRRYDSRRDKHRGRRGR